LDKGVNWNFRPNTQDEWIYNEVYVSNCYRLPDDMSGKAVIDIGANIGTFAAACLERGSQAVYCFEPDRATYQSLIQHLISFEAPRWAAIQSAVVGKHRTGRLYLTLPKACNGTRMTGGQHVTTEDTGDPITATSLSKFLSGRAGSFWLKLDCEGSEHEILADDLPWDQIEQIFGEIHDCGPGANAESLRERLVSVGYQVEIVPNSEDPILALFFASKPGVKTDGDTPQ
jgi:FkbM family methyltransferase